MKVKEKMLSGYWVGSITPIVGKDEGPRVKTLAGEKIKIFPKTVEMVFIKGRFRHFLIEIMPYKRHRMIRSPLNVKLDLVTSTNPEFIRLKSRLNSAVFKERGNEFIAPLREGGTIFFFKGLQEPNTDFVLCLKVFEQVLREELIFTNTPKGVGFIFSTNITVAMEEMNRRLYFSPKIHDGVFRKKDIKS